MKKGLAGKIKIPRGSHLGEQDYRDFLEKAYCLMAGCPQYFAPDEDVNSLELAHLIPAVPETVIAVYTAINNAVCNKGLVSPFLICHAHNNVFVFDPDIYAGGDDVPGGTIDAREVVNGFEPPNETWNREWTYVMIEDPLLAFESLWRVKGYIDMVPAKFEDFTMLSDPAQSAVCVYIDPAAFEHPVNAARRYLKDARRRGEKMAGEFEIPKAIEGEFDGLAPVILDRGEKLYVATKSFVPCAHGWSNLHPANKQLAVINENSAVPLDLVIAKPRVKDKYSKSLIPPGGSADLTTDWFCRCKQVVRTPLLRGLIKG